MRFSRLISPSLTDLFVREIVKRIVSGQLAVGERLPNERELAKMMRVSRAVINGGVAQLARMGFVAVVPRRGIFVSDYRVTGSMESLQAILEYNGGKLESAVVDSFYELRDIDEAHIVTLAAHRRTDQDVADLRAQIGTLEQCDDVETLVQGTFNFHLLLAKASGNLLYPMLIHSRKVIYEPLLRAVYRQVPGEDRLRRMRRLVEYIEEKNPEAAADCIRETAVWSRKVLEAYPEPEPGFMQKNAPEFEAPRMLRRVVVPQAS